MSKLKVVFQLISTSSLMYRYSLGLPQRIIFCQRCIDFSGTFTKRQHHDYRSAGYSQHLSQSRYAVNPVHDNDDDGHDGHDGQTLTMENIYTEWTVLDDKILYDNFNQPLHKVASILGRGLNGVAARKKKISNVDSTAYQRLFVKEKGKIKLGSIDQEVEQEREDSKLVPVMEVLRRIQWDNGLDGNDFTVQYFDRVEERNFECPFGKKNDSVKGKEELFVFAIPDHRIASIKFRERIVWDKESRLDCVFGSMNGKGETIYEVIQTYDQWKKDEDEKKEFNKRKQRELASQLRLMLGDSLFSALKEISQGIQEKATISNISEQDVIIYVEKAISLFRRADLSVMNEDESKVVDDIDALNTFSDLVALLPDENLREKVLLHIHQLVTKLEYEKSPKNQVRPLPELDEDDLIESFVRGSGAGGQKINKTSNKVVLKHVATQIRVECQDTRSLQQNRKIARKRMQLKLDQHYNGLCSRTEMKVAKKIDKKAKTKARNKARQRKKREAAVNEDELINDTNIDG